MNTGHKPIPGCTVRTLTRNYLDVWMQLKDPELLLALMKSKNKSGRQVSTAAGWRSHTYLQRLLRGEVNTLEPAPALAIAEFLDVPPHVLFLTKVDRKTIHDDQESRRRKSA